MEAHLSNNLKKHQSDGDPAMYYWMNDGQMARIAGMYVEDVPNADNLVYQSHTEATIHKFYSKPRVYDELDLFGAQIRHSYDTDFNDTEVLRQEAQEAQ